MERKQAVQEGGASALAATTGAASSGGEAGWLKASSSDRSGPSHDHTACFACSAALPRGQAPKLATSPVMTHFAALICLLPCWTNNFGRIAAPGGRQERTQALVHHALPASLTGRPWLSGNMQAEISLWEAWSRRARPGLVGLCP